MKPGLWLDSHCHPQYLMKIEDDKEDSTEFEASISQLTHALMVSVQLDDRVLLQSLAQQYPWTQWSLGIHPCYLKNACLDQFIQTCKEYHSFDAIGETGLDFFHSKEEITLQHNFFEAHLECARLLKKPVIIHTREAGLATLSVLKRYPGVRGVIHCFTESLEFAKQVLDLGWMISFSGILTFPKAQFLRDIAAYVPIDSILIETDAPYLAPIPFRGKPNQPHWVEHVGVKLAEIKSISIPECQNVLLKNYKNFLEINM
jgi:TatD DNase family protein